MTTTRERMVHVVGEALFEEERNASTGFDCWPESFHFRLESTDTSDRCPQQVANGRVPAPTKQGAE